MDQPSPCHRALLDTCKAIASAALSAALTHNLSTTQGQISALNAIAEAAAVAIADTYGGRYHIWIPSLSALTREARDAAIHRRFHGDNTAELAAEFGVSEATVRRAVQRATASRP